MWTTKQMVRGALFPSLGSVPSLRHCTVRKKAILIDFRRYLAWHFFRGCLRASLWLHQTSAAKRASFPEMETSCSAHKRFLSFWPWNRWCKVSDCRDGVVRSAWSAPFGDLGQPCAAPGWLKTLGFPLQPRWSEGLPELHTTSPMYRVTKMHVIYVSAF